MTAPEVSIVVPNFNKAAFIAETIQSVLSQGEVAEAIFVDDFSTDGSFELLQAAASRSPRFTLIRAPVKRGGSACRNLGLKAARGKFVIFLDSDDLLVDSCCRSRLAAAAAAPEHDLWIFPMEVFRDHPDRPVDRWIPQHGDHLRHFLSHRLDWSVMQPLWRTSFAREIGGFDESFERLQDPEIHTKALLRNARVALYPDFAPDCRYRVSADRHDDDATLLARSHVAGSIRFYRVFAEMIDAKLLPLLSGNLLSCQGMLLQWWRYGRITPGEVNRLNSILL